MSIPIIGSQPAPWGDAKKAEVAQVLTEEGLGIAKRIGAEGVMLIAFFKNGNRTEVVDAGFTPMPPAKLYTALAVAHEAHSRKAAGPLNRKARRIIKPVGM